MKTIKRTLIRYIDYYLLVAGFFATYLLPVSVSPIAIAFIFILILQLIFKNRIMGFMIASAFSLVNVYLLLALLAEFDEIAIAGAEGISLILVGLSLIVLNIMVSVVMVFKYALPGEQTEFKVLQSI
ncbi:hypothetical protein [Chryseosolibacter indicus]|uniref:Uncharacterized protein n=1 Tax=Chryseosolibacter indicus TaxID=2782351 RepID=A0ABS5VZE6_9BACT|nr:hypothetical protein [Chryseosolibacter indicus]MBT1706448.1 hypothetical protein [Chryseosolibacter indicus]